jgi:hypothetical protein
MGANWEDLNLKDLAFLRLAQSASCSESSAIQPELADRL